MISKRKQLRNEGVGSFFLAWVGFLLNTFLVITRVTKKTQVFEESVFLGQTLVIWALGYFRDCSKRKTYLVGSIG